MALTNAELLALLERSPEKPQPIIQLQPGQDGVGIESIREEEGEVVVVFTDEREERFSLPVPKDGEKGEPGAQGPKGERGATGKEGPRGVIGLQGVQGPSGEDGFDGRDGRGLSSAGIGASGRLFLTFSDGEIVDAGKAQGDQGLPGEAGRNGTAGTKILSGQGAPKSGVGEVGDYYIDFASEDVAFYGPKTKKGWGSPSTRLRQKLPKNAMMAAGGGGSGGGGGVVSVSTQLPIENIGTATKPNLYMAPATDAEDGYMSKEDHQKLANIAPGADVTSVFGRDGEVTAQEGDYSLNQIGGVTIDAPADGEFLVYQGGEWTNELVTPPVLVILGSVDITQPVPPTYDGQPYVPSTGNMWVNTTTGVADATWIGIAGETIAANTAVVYAPDNSWHVGGVIGMLADYVPLSGADLSSDAAHRGPRLDGSLRLNDVSGNTNLILNENGNININGNVLNLSGTDSNYLIRGYGNTTKTIKFQLGDGTTFNTYFELKRLSAGDDSVTVYSVPLTLKSTGIGDSGINLSNNGQLQGAWDSTTGDLWTNGEIAITHPNDGSESVLAAYGGTGTNLHIKIGSSTTGAGLTDVAEFTAVGTTFLKPVECSEGLTAESLYSQSYILAHGGVDGYIGFGAVHQANYFQVGTQSHYTYFTDNAASNNNERSFALFGYEESRFMRPLKILRPLDNNQTGSTGFNLLGVRPGYINANSSILYTYYKTYSNVAANNTGDSIRYEGAIEDSKDLVNKGYVDSKPPGTPFTWAATTTTGDELQPGECTLSSDGTFIFSKTNANGGDIGISSEQHITGVKVQYSVYRQVSSGAWNTVVMGITESYFMGSGTNHFNRIERLTNISSGIGGFSVGDIAYVNFPGWL